MPKNSKETLTKRNELRAHYKATIDPSTVPLYKERQCKGCEKIKPCRWMSTFTQTGLPEYRNRCDDCWNIRGRERTKASRGRLTAQKQDRALQRKRACVEYLGGSCRSCGYSRCTKAMTFHHTDSASKSFSISERVDAPWVEVQKELDKCELLCFNCHMERHCVLDMDLVSSRGETRRIICSHYAIEEWEG